MFCQVSGECGRCLQGSCQGGPQRPEESTEAEKTQNLPAAVTLGQTALSGTVMATDPGLGHSWDSDPSELSNAWHLGLDSWSIFQLSPLGSCSSSRANDGVRPTNVPLPWDWHMFLGHKRALVTAPSCPSHACFPFQTQFTLETQKGIENVG